MLKSSLVEKVDRNGPLGPLTCNDGEKEETIWLKPGGRKYKVHVLTSRCFTGKFWGQ